MALYGVETVVTYVAWDTANNAGKTGDASNHTLRWVKDGSSSAPSNSPSEVDATNAPGVYKLTLTNTECQALSGTLSGKSASTGVVIIPVQVMFERLPNVAPGSSGGLPLLDANSRVSADVTAISGDATAADNAEAMFDGTGYAGGTTKLEVNVTQIEGSDATNQIRDAVVDDATRLDGSALNTLAGHDPGTTLGTSTLTAADVWGYTTRTLTSFGTLVSDVATAVWAASTRTLTSFGTLASDAATAVWAATTRTLTSLSGVAGDVWAYATRTVDSVTGSVGSIATNGITSDSIADGAITADAIATDAIGADELSDDAIAEIATAILTELVATHKATDGSVAAVLNEIWRRVGYGAIVSDSDANTIATYDAATATGDPVLTQTGVSVGSETTWTPS